MKLLHHLNSVTAMVQTCCPPVIQTQFLQSPSGAKRMLMRSDIFWFQKKGKLTLGDESVGLG